MKSLFKRKAFLLSQKNYHCHVELTLDIIGGKWKPIILYFIGKNKVLRYGEIKKSIPNINERMLTRQLRELEKHHLIHREIFKEIPPKVEYSLTPVGESVMPILYQMLKWGIKYNDDFEIAEFNI